MKLQLLGTRGEIIPSSPPHERHSGVLVDKELLLDLGEQEYLRYKPKFIFITHLHPDHAYFARDKSLQLDNANIYLPEKCSQLPNAKVLTRSIQLGEYKVTPIPTRHSLKVKSQAYLIQKNQERILYTGDLISIDQRYHHLIRNLDAVITEASFIRASGLVKKDELTGQVYGHAGIPDLLTFFSKLTSRIVLVHFGSWFYRDKKEGMQKIQALAKENAVEVTVGHDGMKIEI